MSLMEEMNARALSLGVPIAAHLDVTYRCNERCAHCYLPHDDRGEMTTAEIFDLLAQFADAGVFFLTLSGGEPMLRHDFFQIVERARELTFSVKLKTNAILIREKESTRLRRLGIENVQISVYSHRPEVHDGITKVPGSLARTVAAIRMLRAHGLKVAIANVLMRLNRQDYAGVQALAAEVGASFTMDPTVTPHIEGDRSLLALNVSTEDLAQAFRTPSLVGGSVDEFCAPPGEVSEDDLDGLPCSAGHTTCYVSPYGDVFPCVQFPLPSGNVRQQRFLDIWRHSGQLADVRSIRARDLPVCTTCVHVGGCTRCPGLAYMEGNMRGPSTADCEKSYVRTAVPTANLLPQAAARHQNLIQILPTRITASPA